MNQTPPPAFANRYSSVEIFKGISKDQKERFFNSASGIVYNQVLLPLVSGYRAIQFEIINQVAFTAHQTACIELGRQSLFDFHPSLLDTDTNFGPDCIDYVANHRAPPEDRLSFVEYLLIASHKYLPIGWPQIEERINRSLQSSSIRLVYADLQFRPTDASLIETEIHEPFWELIGGSDWPNVRSDMEQALKLRDTGGPDPAFYAARALESAIKIVSDKRRWSNGKERSAVNYIDNLVSQKNGRFIAVWEADTLKDFFGRVRNPTAHGAGSDEQPRLSKHQAAWAIEFCIIWIKSLVGRL